MKRLKTIILTAVMAAALTACGSPRLFEKADAIENPNRFRIESGGTAIGVALVTDRETGVQYLINTSSGEITVLVDKEGNPYIANGWRDYE